MQHSNTGTHCIELDFMSKSKSVSSNPEVTIVIPVYNEEGIISASLADLLLKLENVDFYHESLIHLRNGVELVVGSKRAPGARDRRPMYRRAATQVLNGMLRVAVGFRGTDTHGLKAFRRDALIDIVEACVVDKDMFASEFVVRTHRAERAWIEIPIDLIEKRPPSIHLFRRVPNVLRNIARLTAIIRFGRDIPSRK